MKKICNNCREFKEHHAYNLCKSCYNNQWKKNNPEKVKKEYRRYYLKNIEKVKIRRKRYKKNNPEKQRGYDFKRRASGIIEKGILSKIKNENIFKYGVVTCEKCKRKCPKSYHFDHIKPVSKDGNNDYSNLQVLCAKCNLRKHVEIKDYRLDSISNQFFLKEVNSKL